MMATDEVHNAAHACPKCGRMQFTMYFGEAEFILPRSCGTPSEETEKMSVDDYINAIECKALKALEGMSDDDILYWVVTGALPRQR